MYIRQGKYRVGEGDHDHVGFYGECTECILRSFALESGQLLRLLDCDGARYVAYSARWKLLLTSKNSTTRLSDPERTAIANIITRCAQFRDFVYAGECGCGGWLCVISVLFAAIEQEIQELRPRSTPCDTGIQTCARAQKTGRGLVVGGLAQWEAHRSARSVVAHSMLPLLADMRRRCAPIRAHISPAVNTRSAVPTPHITYTSSEDHGR